VHFACHAVNGDCLARLDLMVAGEPFSLDAALIASDLHREILASDQRGPMVSSTLAGPVRKAQRILRRASWINGCGTTALWLCWAPFARC